MGGGKKTISGSDVRVELAPFNPIGSHIQNSSIDAVVALTPPNTPIRATKVIVQATGQNNIRYTVDGAAPTPTFGFRLLAGSDPIMVTLGPNTNIQVVSETAGAILDYVWGQ
jgi:hypothetical protein